MKERHTANNTLYVFYNVCNYSIVGEIFYYWGNLCLYHS